MLDVSIHDAGSGDDEQGIVIVTVTNSTNKPVTAPVIIESNVPLNFWMDGKKLSPSPEAMIAVQATIPRVSSRKFTITWKDPTTEIKFIQMRAKFTTEKSDEIEIN